MKLHDVPAKAGIAWVRAGLRTFFRQPLALAGLFFMYMAVVLVVAMVPVLGPVMAGMVVPAATLGQMAATAEAARGKFPMPSILFSAFRAGRQRMNAMIVLGVVYALGSLAAGGLASLWAGAPATAGEEGPLPGVLVLTLVLHTPLFLMFWHAPALVHWHGVSPGKSLFFSLVAVWRNLRAHLVFSLAWVVVFLLVGSVLGVGAGLIGGPGMVQTVMLPAALLLATMFSTSIYFSFKDCFMDESAAALQPEVAQTPSPPAD